MDKETIISRLYKIIGQRINSESKESYVKLLHNQGIDKIAEKIGEESIETIIAILKKDKKNIIHESADLIFMLLIAWAEKGIRPDEVFEELIRREGVSGIKEKENRLSDI